MSASDLDAEISTKEKEITSAESNFKVPPLLCPVLHCCCVLSCTASLCVPFGAGGSLRGRVTCYLACCAAAVGMCLLCWCCVCAHAWRWMPAQLQVDTRAVS